jgi:hypothetical protein
VLADVLLSGLAKTKWPTARRLSSIQKLPVQLSYVNLAMADGKRAFGFFAVRVKAVLLLPVKRVSKLSLLLQPSARTMQLLKLTYSHV